MALVQALVLASIISISKMNTIDTCEFSSYKHKRVWSPGYQPCIGCSCYVPVASKFKTDSKNCECTFSSYTHKRHWSSGYKSCIGCSFYVPVASKFKSVADTTISGTEDEFGDMAADEEEDGKFSAKTNLGVRSCGTGSALTKESSGQQRKKRKRSTDRDLSISELCDQAGIRFSAVRNLNCSDWKNVEKYIRKNRWRNFTLLNKKLDIKYALMPLDIDYPERPLRQELLRWLSEVYAKSKDGLRKEFPLSDILFKYNQADECTFIGEEFILPWLRFAYEDKVRLLWTKDMGVGLVAAKDLVCPSGSNQSPTIVPGGINMEHVLPKYAFRVSKNQEYGTITGPSSLANAACAKHSKALFTRRGGLKMKKGVKIRKGEQIFVKYGQENSGEYMPYLKCPFC
jgi:hypothetical protein